MTLNALHVPVPDRFVTDRFVVRRQREHDTFLDYEAVMDSRAELRVWSDSPWPEDDFTLDANTDDLRMHIGEHERHEAYGFSVFTPDETRLLGSLYLNDVTPLLEFYALNAEEHAALQSLDARVEYWLRRGTTEAFEVAFVQDLRQWLATHWWFSRVAFGSRRGMHAQRARYERAGLSEIARLTSKDGQRRFHFHA